MEGLCLYGRVHGVVGLVHGVISLAGVQTALQFATLGREDLFALCFSKRRKKIIAVRDLKQKNVLKMYSWAQPDVEFFIQHHAIHLEINLPECFENLT